MAADPVDRSRLPIADPEFAGVAKPGPGGVATGLGSDRACRAARGRAERC